jgi:uncharacterized protein YdhG (YjbR/CyaY superfamily)
MSNPAKAVDEYIKQFPPEIQKGLKELRAFIKVEVTEAEEKIAYRMPSYHLNGALIYFAAFKDHYSLYPIPAGKKMKTTPCTEDSDAKGGSGNI